MHRIGPMSSTDVSLKRFALPDEIFLRSVLNRHITSVDAESILRRRRREIVMGNARVPDDEVTWFSTDFNPLTTFVRQPFHAFLGEPKPLVCPCGDLFFIGKLLMESVTLAICTFADNQPPVIRSVWKKIDEAHELAIIALKRDTLEGNGSQALLDLDPDVAMVCWGEDLCDYVELEYIRTGELLGEAKIDSVEGNDEIFRVINLLKGTDDPRLAQKSASEKMKIECYHRICQTKFS